MVKLARLRPLQVMFQEVHELVLYLAWQRAGRSILKCCSHVILLSHAHRNWVELGLTCSHRPLNPGHACEPLLIPFISIPVHTAIHVECHHHQLHKLIAHIIALMKGNAH